MSFTIPRSYIHSMVSCTAAQFPNHSCQVSSRKLKKMKLALGKFITGFTRLESCIFSNSVPFHCTTFGEPCSHKHNGYSMDMAIIVSGHRHTLTPVLLAGTNFSDLEGSRIWRVLTLSLATRTHKDLVEGKFPDATISGYKI